MIKEKTDMEKGGAVLEVRGLNKSFKSFSLRDFSSVNLATRLCYLLHFLFDFSNVFICKHYITKIHIIVETFLYYWTNPKLSVWIKMLYSLCHHMSTRVVEHV